MTGQDFKLGDWQVRPRLNQLERGDDEHVSLENKAMDVLVLLARTPGNVVSADQIIAEVWNNRPMGDNPVYKAVNQLRKALDDDPKNPGYIETIAGRGYRLVAPVSVAGASAAGSRREFGLAAAVLLLVLAGALAWFGRGDGPAPDSDGEAEVSTIAVLPFDILSSQPDLEFLGTGFAESVLNDLATVPGLRVLARNASFGSAAGDADVALEKLGVDYVLGGSLQTQHSTLRVAARLIDKTGTIVWSRTFDHDVDDLFAVQNDVSTAVLRAMQLEISRPAVAVGTTNADAYKAWLTGREYVTRRPARWPDLAIEAFNEAIRLDSEFANPYAGIAMVEALRSMNRPGRGAVAEELLATAFELNPQLAEAHAVAGLLKSREESIEAHEDAIQSFRQALALNPAWIDARNWLSISLIVTNQYREAAQVLQEALALDPLNPTLNMNYGSRLMADGQLDAAREQFLRTLESPDSPAYGWGWLANVERSAGDYRAALQWTKRGLAQIATAEETVRWVGNEVSSRYADLGMFDEANAWLATVQLPEINHWWMAGQFAVLSAEGRYDELGSIAETHVAAHADGESMTKWSRSMVGTIAVERGDYAAAIEWLEPLFPDDWLLYNGPGGRSDLFAVAHALIVAYNRAGQQEKADKLLASLSNHQRIIRSGRSRVISNFLVDEAVTMLLAGDNAQAVERLSEAIDAGWRDYFHAIHQQRFLGFRDIPASEALLQNVADELSVQREEVLARERLQPFNPADALAQNNPPRDF